MRKWAAPAKCLISHARKGVGRYMRRRTIMKKWISRRNFLKATGISAVAAGLTACGGSSSSTSSSTASGSAPRGYPQTGRRDFQRALQKPNCGLTAQRGVEPGTGRSDRAQPRCHEHDAEDWTGSVELNCRKRTHDRRFRLRQKRLYQLFRQNERRHRIRLRTARIGRARVG